MLILTSLLFFSFFSTNFVINTGYVEENSEFIDFTFDNSLPESSASTYIDPPKNFFTNLTNIIYTKGTAIAGDIDSLGEKGEEDALALQPYNDGYMNYEFNITFEYGCDLSFAEYPLDYYDLYLYLDWSIQQSGTVELCLETYTFESNIFLWNSIEESKLKTGSVNISDYYLEKAFKFKLCYQWTGASVQISIDRFQIVLTHNGPTEKDLSPDYKLKIADYKIFSFHTELSENDTNWFLDPLDDEDVTTHSVYTNVADSYFSINIYFNEIPLSLSDAIFSSRIYTRIMLWHNDETWRTYNSNFHIRNNSLDTWTQVFDVGGMPYAAYGDSLLYEEVNSFQFNNIMNYPDLMYDLERDKYYMQIHFYTYAAQNPDPDEGTEITMELRYLNITNFKGIYYPHYLISVSPAYENNRLNPDDNFKIQAKPCSSSTSNSQQKVFRRVIGEAVDSGWCQMPTYDESLKQWNSSNIDASVFPEGYYNIWVNYTDSKGFSTLNLTKILIYNGGPLLDFRGSLESEQKIDFSYYDKFLLWVNVSDEEDDNIINISAKIHEIGNEQSFIMDWTELSNETGATENDFLLNITKDMLNNPINQKDYTLLVKTEDQWGDANYTMNIKLILFPISSDSASSSDKDKHEEENPNSLLLVILITILIISLAFILSFGYILKRKKLKKKVLNDKLKSLKLKGNIINCPFCHKEIAKDIHICSYCGSSLIEDTESQEIIIPQENITDNIHTYEHGDFYEKIFLQSSNILKIWIFDAKSKVKIYEETLNLNITEIEKQFIDLDKILNGEYEKNKFIEEVIEFEDNKYFVNYINYQNPIILILISGKKFDKDFIDLINATVKKIDIDKKELSKNPVLIKKLLDDGIFLFNSRIYNQVSTVKKNLLEKIFKSDIAKNSILSEIPRLPIGTFEEFLKLFEKLVAEYEYVETRGKFNNSKYFEEGGY